MPIANVIRVSILGANPNGEVWSVNPVWQIGGSSTSEDVTQADVVAMSTALAALTLSTAITGMWPLTTSLTGYRVEARRWNGQLAAQAESNRGTPIPGTSGTQHPFQTSIVASLRTGAVGASGRGRLYFPATGLPLGSNLRPASGTVNSILLGVKTLLNAMTGAIAPSLTNAPVLSVWSRKLATTNPVTSLLMGDVLDVQRRRRDALIEGISSTTFP